MNRTRKLLIAGSLALVAAVAIGCGGDSGGDEDPAEVLRESFSQDISYDSGVINIGISGSLEGEQSGSIEADISGPFTSGGEGEKPEFQLDATADVSAENLPDVPGGSFSFNFDGGFGLADDSLFVNYNDTSYAASDELYAQIEPFVTAATEAEESTEESDPEPFIDALTNLENEGTEDVDGESAIHLSGDLDIAALAESGATEASPVPFDPAQLEGLGASVDVYVGEEDKAFRKIEFTLAASDVEALSTQGVDGLDFTVSFGISEPNSEQDVTAPADAQPLDDLLGQFGASEQAILEQIQGLGALGALGAGGGLPGGGDLPAGGSGIPGGDEVLDCLSQAGNDAEAAAACLE